MGYRTTRPQGALRACRIRSYVAALAVLAGLAGAPALAQTGTAQVDRVIDGDTISVRLDGVRYTRHGSLDRRGHARDEAPDAGR